MAHDEHVPVLIIGGGVVGLSASLFLAHHGIQTLLVERHQGTYIHPRARSVNARTMEFFRHIGIDERVREAGAAISASMGMHSGASLKEVLEAKPRKDGPRKLPLAGLLDGVSPVSGTFVTQDMLEPVLVDVARERGVEVRFHTECVGVEQDEGGVTATLKDRESGISRTVRSEYLIAADGANSPIRMQMGVSTSGRGTLGHLLNILFEADLGDLVRGREFSLCMIERPEVSGLFTSVNNSDRWVFHLLYDPSRGEAPSDFTPQRCKDLLRIAVGEPDLDLTIKSILPWEPSVRVAEQFQHKRIFLAGDAAHQMPPWAGQGANSGIADVHNLAWKLAAVMKGYARQILLETYDVERMLVDRLAAETSGNAADERGVIMMKKNLTFFISVFKRAQIVSGHGYHYKSGAVCEEDTSPLGGWSWRPWTLSSLFFAMDGRPGSRVPHLWVERRGQRTSTLDVCGNGFVLLAGSEGSKWMESARQVSSTFKVNIEAYRVGPGLELVSPQGDFEAAAGISRQGAILVRPDDFVVWRTRRQGADDHAELERAMKQALCLKPA